MDDVLDWKDDVCLKHYGSLDPWSPITQDISQSFCDATLMNLQIHDYTHNNKCQLNYETYDTMCYAVYVLQDHFRRIINNLKMSFLSDDNMLKYIKMILHSLHYVNINFIEKFCAWLDMDNIAPRVRLFRMLGLFVQYLTTPTLFEAAVLDEQHKIKTSYPMGLEIDMNKKEN